MSYDFDTILIFGTIHCGLITSYLYMRKLNKRSHFWLRFGACCSVAVLFVPEYMNIQSALDARYISDGTPVESLEFYGGLFIYSAVMFVITLFILSMIFYISCEMQLSKAVYGALCAYITEELAYTVFVIFMPDAAHRISGIIQVNTLWLELLIMLIIYALSYLLFARTLPEKGEFRFNTARLVYVTIALVIICKMLGLAAKLYDSGESVMLYRSMLIYDAMLSALILAIQIIYRYESYYRKTAEVESKLRKMQASQYEAFRKSADNLKHQSHDFKYFVASLKAGEDYSPAQRERIEAIRQELEVFDAITNTGNDTVDALLSENSIECTRNAIQWTCMADGTIFNFMDPLDIYVLLGNALDNALENTLKVENPEMRFMSVNMWKKHGAAFLRVENYCSLEDRIYDKLPASTKPEDESHGYGLKSIMETAEKYGGHVKIEVRNHIFILTVSFIG